MDDYNGSKNTEFVIVKTSFFATLIIEIVLAITAGYYSFGKINDNYDTYVDIVQNNQTIITTLVKDAQEAAKAAAEAETVVLDPDAPPGGLPYVAPTGYQQLAGATVSAPAPVTSAGATGVQSLPGSPSLLVAPGAITTAIPGSTVPPPNITEEQVIKAVMENLDDQKYYAKMALLGVIGQGVFYVSLGLIGVGTEHKWCTLFFAVIALIGDVVCLFRLQGAWLVILAFIFNVIQTILAFYYFDRLNVKQSMRAPVSTNMELM